VNPQVLGRFWESALSSEMLTDAVDGFETRMAIQDGPVLDVCFQRVPARAVEPPRLHLDLRGGEEQQQVVERLLGLGARRADIGQGDVPWVVLADPEGNPFCVMENRPEYAAAAGPVAALPLDVADPARERDFWAWLTGWAPVEGAGLVSLQHVSRRGPLLELCQEARPKGSTKNLVHLDIRLEPSDDADTVAREIVQRGGRELHPDWGELPWRVFMDLSGNEFCLLPMHE
jgi:predicted enzyme related to lactoylglutathione lyase